MIEDEVAIVVAEAPEFAHRCLRLIGSADGDPGAGVVLAELADYVSGLAADMERFRPSLVRCLAAVEKVAATSADAEELVVWSFADNLSPDDLRRLEPWLGPRTRSLLDEADRTPAGQ